MESYRIDIVGLTNKTHEFQYEIGDEFFKRFEADLQDGSKFYVEIQLDKRETLIEADFHIKGEARLICDRCLEPYNHAMELNNRIIFKYGPEEKEISDEMVMITHETEKLDVGQFIYEFIELGIPMKKLHPKFSDEDPDKDVLIYRSENDADSENDPRWDALKKLKKN